MPLKHLRTCDLCQTVRWAPCSIVCRIPPDHVKDSWQENIEDGAGRLLRGPVERCAS